MGVGTLKTHPLQFWGAKQKKKRGGTHRFAPPQRLGRAMTSAEFIANLSGMMDGQDFPREQLKVFWGGGSIRLKKRGAPPKPFFFSPQIPFPTPPPRLYTAPSATRSWRGQREYEVKGGGIIWGGGVTR